MILYRYNYTSPIIKLVMSVQTKINVTIPALVKKDDYIIIQERPCRVTQATKATIPQSKTKCIVKYRFVGIDIFTKERYECYASSDVVILVPIVTKTDYELRSITKVKLNNGDLRDDIYVSDPDLACNLQSALLGHKLVIATITTSIGIEQITAFRSI